LIQAKSVGCACKHVWKFVFLDTPAVPKPAVAKQTPVKAAPVKPAVAQKKTEESSSDDSSDDSDETPAGKLSFCLLVDA